MSKVEVNFLNNPENQENPRERRLKPPKPGRGWKKIIIVLIVIIIMSLIIFYSAVIFSGQGLINNLSKFNLFHQVGQLIGSKDKNLDGEDQDRVNFLIIGQGGKNHQGGTLADTIILASYKPSTSQVAMMSIPRDTQYCENAGSCYKINAISAFAEQKTPGSGGKKMAEALSNLLETDIHYYVIVDFDGFEKVIDEFGGVDVDVENDLIDYQYPIRGKEYVYPIENRFETLNIKRGAQHLDGELALKYARSRHALGAEGSDFARSKRQQKIIMAMKDKIFSIDTFMNPKKINNLLTAYNEHIQTNLEIWEMLRLMQFSKKIDNTAIIHQSLTEGPKPLLRSAMINGSYLLLPTGNGFEDIKNVWQYIFYKEAVTNSANSNTSNKPAANVSGSTTVANGGTTSTATKVAPILPAVEKTFKDEAAKIEIRNGTWINGYATKEKTRLTGLGFIITATANADNHEYAKTVVYDLSGDKYPATASELAKLYDTEVMTKLPIDLTSAANFVIILGGQ